MSSILRAALAVTLAATLAACASQPPAADFSAPPAKRLDAKTSLETQKY